MAQRRCRCCNSLGLSKVVKVRRRNIRVLALVLHLDANHYNSLRLKLQIVLAPVPRTRLPLLSPSPPENRENVRSTVLTNFPSSNRLYAILRSGSSKVQLDIFLHRQLLRCAKFAYGMDATYRCVDTSYLKFSVELIMPGISWDNSKSMFVRE